MARRKRQNRTPRSHIGSAFMRTDQKIPVLINQHLIGIANVAVKELNAVLEMPDDVERFTLLCALKYAYEPLMRDGIIALSSVTSYKKYGVIPSHVGATGTRMMTDIFDRAEEAEKDKTVDENG